MGEGRGQVQGSGKFLVPAGSAMPSTWVGPEALQVGNETGRVPGSEEGDGREQAFALLRGKPPF